MTASIACSTARANDVLINGVPGPGDSSPAFILVDPGLNDDVIINVDTIDIIGPAADTIRVNGQAGSTLLNVAAGRSVSGATSTGVYLRSTTGNIGAVIDGSVTSAFNAVTLDARFAPAGGNVSLSGAGSLFGTGGTAAWLLSDTGSVNLDGFSSITAGDRGVYVNSGGTVNLGTNSRLGTITAGTTGIEVELALDPANNGPITINASDITANGGFGIRTRAFETDTAISLSGTLRSVGGAGIYATSTTGNIVIGGEGTGSVDGGTAGIIADSRFLPPGGNIVISDFASVMAADTGIWALADIGTVNVENIASITSVGHGVHVESSGLVSVGQTTPLGPISAGGNGIFVDQLFDATNNGPLFIGATDITSGAHGIRAIAWDGFTQIQANGAISAGFTGIYGTSTTGNLVIDVASGASVRGGHFGVLTETTTGRAIVNNAGLIGNTADTGAASDAGADAFRVGSGNAVLNNSGSVVGRIDTTGSNSFVLDNQAGGVWTPSRGIVPFRGSDDAIDNYGRINIRSGWTVFDQLEILRNHRGGLIDLSYGPDATDHLVVGDFNATDGSQFTFNFDASAANNAGEGYDNSTDGTGTADTIVVDGTSSVSGRSIVNIVSIGGAPTAETGSVSLIYTGVRIGAPAPDAIVTPSSFFSFGSGNPTTGASMFYLVDDGNGGLYLQWGPNNNSPALLGAFMGGYLADNQFAPSAINAAVGKLGTIVGGVGPLGGPSGGGVVGRIGDDASMSMLAPRSSRCRNGRLFNTWFLVGSAGAGYSPGGQGSTVGFAAGMERDLSDVTDAECGRTALGAFFFDNQTNDRWLSGSSFSQANGLGAYVRAGGGDGWYGSLIGSLAWSDTDLVNSMYNSTGNQDNTGYSLVALGGYLIPVTDAASLDFRGIASYGNVNGKAFTDSNAMTINGTDSGITTLGLLSGINYRLTGRQNVFARAGVKWIDLNRDIVTVTAFQRGSVNAVVGSVEFGYREAITKNVTFDAWLSGDFGEYFASGGGRVGLTIGL